MKKRTSEVKTVVDGKKPVNPFINYDMTDDEKKIFKAWAHENVDELKNLLDKLLDDGMNFSCKWDTFNDCVAAFILCVKDGDERKGFILTGRGSTFFGASMGVLYKHYVLLEGNWPLDTVRRNQLDDD